AGGVGAEAAAVRVQPDAGIAIDGVFDHVHHLRVEHRLPATGTAHPSSVTAALVGHFPPQCRRQSLGASVAVETANRWLSVRVRAVRAAKVTRIDDEDDALERKCLRAGPQAILSCLHASRHLALLAEVHSTGHCRERAWTLSSREQAKD